MKIETLIKLEEKRQNEAINLIASESICLPEVRKILDSCLTNKYAEGFPGNRYYGGCEIIDEIEKLAQEECNSLFNCEYSNVQPHAGVEANLIAYKALLNKGDTILSMDLSSGGHLSHSHKKHIVSDIYNIETYNVNKETYYIDYDEIKKKALLCKPKVIVAGASAYSRLIDYKIIKNICQKVNAYLIVDMAHIAGLVAAKIIPSPVEYADIVTFTTHKTLCGPRGGCIISKKEFQKKIESATIPGLQGGPFINVIAAKAKLFELAKKNEFIEMQKKIIEYAKYISKFFIEKGLHILTNGTDVHQLTINVSKNNMTGKEVEKILSLKNIIVNKNLIPFDTMSPLQTSGIRLGTTFIVNQNKTIKDLNIICKKITDIFNL